METNAEVHRAHPVHHEENCCHEEKEERRKVQSKDKKKKQSGWGPEYLFVLGARWQEVEIIASGKDAVMKAQGRKDGREEGRRRRREGKKVERSAGRKEDTRRRKGGRGAKISPKRFSEEKKRQGKEGRIKDMRHEKHEKTLSRSIPSHGPSHNSLKETLPTSITPCTNWRGTSNRKAHFRLQPPCPLIPPWLWDFQSTNVSSCSRIWQSLRLFTVCRSRLLGCHPQPTTPTPWPVSKVRWSHAPGWMCVWEEGCFGSVAQNLLARVSTRLFFGCQNLIRSSISSHNSSSWIIFLSCNTPHNFFNSSSSSLNFWRRLSPRTNATLSFSSFRRQGWAVPPPFVLAVQLLCHGLFLSLINVSIPTKLWRSLSIYCAGLAWPIAHGCSRVLLMESVSTQSVLPILLTTILSYSSLTLLSSERLTTHTPDLDFFPPEHVKRVWLWNVIQTWILKDGPWKLCQKRS